MTAVTNIRSFRCTERSWTRNWTCLKTYFQSRQCLFYLLLILLNGCSLVKDFKNFRLCSSATSHASTKLPAAKYMSWKFRHLKVIEPAFALYLLTKWKIVVTYQSKHLFMCMKRLVQFIKYWNLRTSVRIFSGWNCLENKNDPRPGSTRKMDVLWGFSSSLLL